MTTVIRSWKFKMPSVYLAQNERVYRCKVGYYRNRNGKRQKKEFRLGTNPVEAYKKAVLLGEAWVKEVERAKKITTEFRELVPDEPKFMPIWTGLPVIEGEGRNLRITEPPDDGLLPGDIESNDVCCPTKTLKQASLEFLARLMSKVKRDAKSSDTYRFNEQHLRLGLVKPAIDPALPVSLIKLHHIEKYCDFWCNITDRTAESARKQYGPVTAQGRLDSLAHLLRDLSGRVDGFQFTDRMQYRKRGTPRKQAENREASL